MSNRKVKPEGLADAMNEIINDYVDEITEDLPTITKDVGKKCAEILKAKAQSAGIGGSKYIRSFKSKVTGSSSAVTEVTVYSSQYQVAHLLEHGHDVLNNKGGKAAGGQVIGSARAFPHWAPAEREASEELEKKIRLKIEGSS